MARRKGGAGKPRWQIVLFKRHKDDDPRQTVPGRDYLDACPDAIRAKLAAVLVAVRDAPPPAFSGGGYWEKMHGQMSGYYEIRADGPQRAHYRLFCILEADDARKQLGASSIVVIAGMTKRFMTTFTDAEYNSVKKLGDEYLRRHPRSVLQ